MSGDEPEEPEGLPVEQRLGESLFDDALNRFVAPAILARTADGSLPEGTGVYRWQVLLPFEGDVEVRLNEEVGGSAHVVPTRDLTEVGEAVTTSDISSVTAYIPREEDADIPHVTAFAHSGGWSLAFEFNYRHPARHKFLALGRDFAVSARAALDAGRIEVALDTAFSAAELLARAELLSCAPTIKVALESRTHGPIRETYSLWGRLENTDRRFVSLLGRLQNLRAPARYLQGELKLAEDEAEKLLTTLLEMVEHVDAIANEAPDEQRRGYNVIATRQLQQGQMVGPEAFTLRPPKRRPSSTEPDGS